MNSPWPRVKLGEVLRRSDATITILPDAEYREVTVRLWAKGVVLRGAVAGASIAASRRFVTKAGQLILSRIDARNGAIGIVPPPLDGAVVTNDFPLFDLTSERIDSGFLGWLTKTRDFVKLCQRASEGTTNRVRLQEDRFLSLEIPLPPLAEQRRIVARIEELAAKIEEARDLRQQAVDEVGALVPARSLTLFRSLGPRSIIGHVCEVIDPNPSHRYPAYVPDGIPIVSSSEFVGDNDIDPSRARRVPPSFYESTLGRFHVGDGDVIFSRKGKVGYARLHPVGAKLAMTHTLCIMKPERSTVEPRYLLHFARSPIFLEELTGTMNPNVGVPTLGLGVIRDASIPLPSISVQRAVVAEVDALQAKVDALKRAQTETAAELDALLPSILDRAFRGQL